MQSSHAAFLQSMDSLARTRGWAIGEPVFRDGLRLPVLRDSDHAPLFELRLWSPGPGPREPCYADANGFQLAYGLQAGVILSPAERQAMLAFLDAVVTRLNEGILPDAVGILPPPPKAVEASRVVLETSRGREVEHLLRIDFHCNQACPFCFVRLGSTRLDPSDLDGLLAVQGPMSGGESVVLTGGEPTLHPQLLPIIERVRALGYRKIALQTNAVRLADLGFTRRIVEAGVGTFFVSFHSHRAATYDRITCSHGQFPRAIAGIRSLLSLGGDVTLNLVLNRWNIRSLRGYLRFVARLLAPYPGKGTVFLTMMNEDGHRKVPELAVPLDVMGRALDQAMPLFDALGLALEPFFGECSPPPCVVREPARVVLPEGRPLPEIVYLAPGEAPPPNRRVKSGDCVRCRFDDRCCGVCSAHASLFGLSGLRTIPV